LGVAKTISKLMILSGINIPGYPMDGEIWHLAHLLKPRCRGLGKNDPPKALTA
jgi:hypothetical protein